MDTSSRKMSRKTLCQFPNCQWPILVYVLEEYTVSMQNSKLQMTLIQLHEYSQELFNQWLKKHDALELTGNSNEIFVPSGWLLQNVLLLIDEMAAQSTDPDYPEYLRNKSEVHGGKSYSFRPLPGVFVGDFVMWLVDHENYFQFGKVQFTGVLGSEQEVPDILISPMPYVGSNVYQTKPENVFSLQEVQRVQIETRYVTGRLEFEHLSNGKQRLCIFPFMPQNEEREKHETRDGEPMDTDDIEKPKTPVPESDASTSESMIPPPLTSITTSESSLPSTPESPDSPTPEAIPKSATTTPDLLDSRTQLIITQLEQSTNNKKMNEKKPKVKPRNNLTRESKTDRKKKGHNQDSVPDPESKKIDIHGNCYAYANRERLVKLDGFQGLPVKGLQLGALIVAQTSNHYQIILGVIKLICAIDDVPFIGVQFEESLSAFRDRLRIYHYEKFHKDKDPCRDNRWVLIEIDCLLRREPECIFQLLDSTPKRDVTSDAAPSTHSIKVNIDEEANRDDEFVAKPLDLVTTVNGNGILSEIGIEGKNNSCYAVTLLFSLFAFTDKFDHSLMAQKDRNMDNVSKAIRNIIKYDVVSQLRKPARVSWRPIQKLRNILATHINPAYESSFMDVEEFGLLLFDKILKAPGFLEYDCGQTDYIHQIFPKDQQTSSPDIQVLLQDSFEVSGVKLAKIPNPAFIIKLPVCDGSPVFQHVYLNDTITLKGFLEEEPKYDEKKYSMMMMMHLRAVICLKSSHFTCFIRTALKKDSRDRLSSSWVYYDSMPEKKDDPLCVEIEGFDEIYREILTWNPSKLAKYINSEDQRGGRKFWIRKLLTTCYMCIYEPVDADEASVSCCEVENSVEAGGSESKVEETAM